MDEKICKVVIDLQSAGVHQIIIETYPDLEYFNSYSLDDKNSSDYDVILCDAAKPKLIEYIKKHQIKAQIIITLFFLQNYS